MKTNLTIHLNHLLFLIFIAGAVSCTKSDEENVTADNNLIAFEKEYINSLNYKSEESIKLIGFKKIILNAEEAAEISLLYDDNGPLREFKNYYFDKNNSLIRVYFPVEGALVEHHNSLIEASDLGELQISSRDVHELDLAVLGRRQTENILGVEGNIIEDGIIYLAEKNRPEHHVGNVFVYDFGIKMIMDHSDHHLESGRLAAGKTSCLNNHVKSGVKRNCSTAFNIKKGRCTFKSNVCMDYNGWFTNCVNGKVSNFPGSDCDYALGAGHCWNELM